MPEPKPHTLSVSSSSSSSNNNDMPTTTHRRTWAFQTTALVDRQEESKRRVTIGCEPETANTESTIFEAATPVLTSQNNSFKKNRNSSLSVHHANNIYQREVRKSVEEYRKKEEEEDEEESEEEGVLVQGKQQETLQAEEEPLPPKEKGSVRFATHAEIRKYPLALGDHPGVWSGGPPLTLDWNHVEVELRNLDLHHRRQRQPRRRTRQERIRLLSKWGVTMRDMAHNTREVALVQKQRHESQQESLVASIAKEWLERTRSKLARWANLGARKRKERAYLEECGVVYVKRRVWIASAIASTSSTALTAGS